MKYSPGLGFGQLSGSLGSTTASHNRYGAYLRSRTIPVNPNTTLQQQQRDDLSQLTTHWRLLTSNQRNDWKTLGGQMTRTDSLGVTYNLTGIQAYISVNRYRILFGLGIVDDAPAMGGVPSLLTLGLTASNTGVLQTLSVTYTPTPLGANNRLMVAATPDVSAGRSFFSRGEYRTVLYSAADAASPLDILAAWQSKFGTLTVGERISVRAWPISADFIAGASLRADAIVSAI